MKEYTSENVKEILSGKGGETALAELLSAYSDNCAVECENGEESVLTALRRDLAYDPDPYISTMDLKPEDRIASRVHPQWTDELTEALAGVCGELLSGDGARAENFFRWNRNAAFSAVISAAKKTGIALSCTEQPERLSFFCPYAFSRLYMAGYVERGSGILLRRVNCRPWGIKPIG